MRRALIMLLLAAPALALGQSTGDITVSDQLLSLAQCTGVQSSDPPVGEAQQLTMAWNIQLQSGVTFSSDGSITLVASTSALRAESWDGTGTTSCGKVVDTDPDTHDVTTLDDIPVGSQTASVRVNANGFASAVSYGCTVNTTQTVHLCLEWSDSTGAPKGWATGTVKYDSMRPTVAPSNPRVSGGNQSIRVNGCDTGTGSARFIARAMIGTDLTTARYSNQSTSCGDLRITGLTNDTQYDVVVFGLSTAGNPSVASNAVVGTPVPTDDFWDRYHDVAGGQEQGGCNTAAGAGILSALSLIAAAAAARRRKP